LFLYGLLLSLWCFSILVNYFQVSCNVRQLCVLAKITQNAVTELLPALIRISGSFDHRPVSVKRAPEVLQR